MPEARFFSVTALCVALLPAVAVPARAELLPYEELAEPRPTAAAPGQVEVLEFFWYGCPHCYYLEPYLEDWRRGKPDWVRFRRVPAPIARHWQPHARAYHVAEALGVVERVHAPLFNALHREKRRLGDFKNLLAFFGEKGVSKEDFTIRFYSEEVEQQMRDDWALMQSYSIGAVPSIIVNGKFLVTPSSVRRVYNGEDYPNVMKVVMELARREYESGRPAQASSGRAALE